MPVWINEFHYDNAGTDAGEFIEIAGTAGTNLTGYSLVLYNGVASQRTTYNTLNLSGTITDQQGGFGTLSFGYPVNGIQNGGAGASSEPDGIALVAPGGVIVVEFISYEGSFVAANGPAAGLASVNVGAGVAEDGNASGTSIARTGTGAQASDFTWQISTDTHGAVNAGQSFGAVATPSVSISDVTLAEGNTGTVTFQFTVTRAPGTTSAFSINFTTADGTATTADGDYATASGTLEFAAGVNSRTVDVVVNGDLATEANEQFFVNLTPGVGGPTITDGQGVGTITNDDAAPPLVAPWINEFHYDNVGGDVGEFVEIAGLAGTNLTGLTLVLYNGNGGASYGTILLNGVIPDQSNGFGTLFFAAPGLQNGGTAGSEPDGIALVGPGDVVLEFISYEGMLTATNGPANGLTSVDVGVAEDPAPAVGGSIARTGAGSEGSDFTWVLVADDTPGAVNAGQTFAAPAARVRVSDASVVEGDAGTSILTFTVTRTGPTQAFSVDFASTNGSATAGVDYTAVGGTLNFAAGQTQATVAVTVQGDATPEPTETLFLNLSNATNGASIADAQGVGTIVTDEVLDLRTFQIQGAGHTSAFVDLQVRTEGVVVAVDTNGFWIQDPTGDGDLNTSDGVFVFTDVAPGVTAGQLVRVEGTVDEFGSGNNLTITEVVASPTAITQLGTGTITPTVLGAGGRLPPTALVDDDGFTVFDPAQDAADFYESLEGMLVLVPDAQVTDRSNGNSFWIVADEGDNATSLNDRGGITIGQGDLNPERIEIFRDNGVLPGFTPNFDMGDRVGDVTGVVGYFGGDYQITLTDIEVTTAPGSPADDVTTLEGDATHLTIAAYNLENIDPGDDAAKFAGLADDIVNALKTPDIIGVEEIQDADGDGGGANLSGEATAARLIDAIVTAGGPRYTYVEVIPTADPGGAPNANIRNGFLYDASRVQFVEGSARAVPDTAATPGDAFASSRRPLAADFVFRGETVTAIDVHSTSRLGSEAGIFGVNQPPANAGDAQRIAQSTEIRAFVLGLQAANPAQHVAVMGDFNGFQFEQSLTLLEQGGSLTNLTNLLDPSERYSFVFEGNSQQIDHLLVSQGLFGGAEFDIVHRNSGQAGFRPTDHDPVLARVLVNTAPVAVAEAFDAVEDLNLVVDAQHGVLANDTDVNSDDLTAVLRQGPAHGTLALGADGSFIYRAAGDYNGPDSFTYVARDPTGADSQVRTVTLQVAAVNDAPVAVADAATVNEDETVVIAALDNDTDVDAGDTKELVSATAASGASVTVVGGEIVYSADADVFDQLQLGQSASDTVTYVIRDSGGLTSTGVVAVTVKGVADGATQFGSNGNDTLTGTQADERMEGGNGVDNLAGLGGSDTLIGGNGADVLDGGEGADRLDGGNGPDTFVFTGAFGHDRVTDLSGEDVLRFDAALVDGFPAVLSHAAQVGADVLISLDAAHSVTLLGVQIADLRANDFLFV